MDTWDNAQPDRDRMIGGASATPGAGAGGGSGPESTEPTELPELPELREPSELPEPRKLPEPSEPPGPSELPELHELLRSVAAGAVPVPQGDLFPKVMARATRIRRRRRAIRASSATAVLVVAAVLGPSVASELGMRGGDASAAPPPSAIVDLTSAYPASTATESPVATVAPTVPQNALSWPSRGATLPAQALDVAKSYLVDQAKRADSATGADPTSVPTALPTSVPASVPTATVSTLWAQVDEDTAAPASVEHGVASKVVTPTPIKTWLYVMQGWTTPADGTPSQAQLLVGDYTQTGKTSSMSVYTAPVAFSHMWPGSSADSDDAQQIAELSVWLPQSNRLVVLGAPQTKTVLYARTGGNLIPQKTVDGVAVFPRTQHLVKGHYADVIQVRDAKNVALTPPDAWSAGDFQLTGPESLWKSGGAGWVALAARPEAAAPSSASK
ncbi:hypothetical protein KGQ20_17975 [Catenulispora sp. NF23]|uniref:hypothetical protein n=1 Tax=Catenulispora pinistramenti TaxID=2705254 RepID=UPI001BA62F71|nr:hypothetical protein [Catenulispora pinistramenti]MBS2534662.1 hypothetical protein [Catenulispora pinistramenti]